MLWFFFNVEWFSGNENIKKYFFVEPATLFDQQPQSPTPIGTIYTVTTERIVKPKAPLAETTESRQIPQIIHSAAAGPVKKPLSPKDISNPIPIKTAPWITPATP